MPWKPSYPGEFPTLGWEFLEWCSEYLAAPDRAEYEPFTPTREQALFALQYFRVDPVMKKRMIRRAVLSRAKGWGKSPFVAAIGCYEAMGNAVFDGWDANGKPIGRPWRDYRTPLVQFAAVNEDQSRNAYDPLLEMLRNGPVLDAYAVDPMDSFVALPRGRMERITAAALSKEGNRPIAVFMDQTESWIPSNGGVKFAKTLRRNLLKTGGAALETPNAFRPGSNSVAETTAAYAQKVREGKVESDSLYWDHREAPADTDLWDKDSLMSALEYVYGDSTWVPLDNIADGLTEPDFDPQEFRQYFLNQVTHASDSWVSHPEVLSIVDRDAQLVDGDTVVLGFDGSRGRARGKPDATALVGMRVKDKHLFVLGIWEKDERDDQDWSPPLIEIDAVIRDTFRRFKVVGFYADPSGWQSQVADWEATYHRKLKVKANSKSPISLWPTGKGLRATAAVEQLRQAIVTGEITMQDHPGLIRHFLNARRRANRNGYLLYKEYPESPNKIDAAYASLMAYLACLDATSAGVGKTRPKYSRQIGVL